MFVMLNLYRFTSPSGFSLGTLHELLDFSITYITPAAHYQSLPSSYIDIVYDVVYDHLQCRQVVWDHHFAYSVGGT